MGILPILRILKSCRTGGGQAIRAAWLHVASVTGRLGVSESRGTPRRYDLIREHLEKIATLEREERKEGTRRLKTFFESERDWFGGDETFDRELANAR